MMMRLVQVAILVAGAMAAMDSNGKTGLDVLAKRFPDNDKDITRRVEEKLPTGIGFLAFMRRLSNHTNTTTTTMAATTTSTTMGATTTSTTTMGATTTSTTMAATTTSTTMGATTTSTTTMGATTTSTTVTTTTVEGQTTTTTTTTTFGGAKFDAKVTLAVADTSWVSNTNTAHNIMKDAINASNPDVTNPNMVTINELKVVTRRLQEKQPASVAFLAFMRRLAAGSIECDYTITFPPTYTGDGYIPAAVDSNAMVAKIQNNDYNVAINVTSVSVAVSACSGGRCSTTTTTTTTVTTTTTADSGSGTTKMATTKKPGGSTGGAVSVQQLAASVVAMILLKMLSGL